MGAAWAGKAWGEPAGAQQVHSMDVTRQGVCLTLAHACSGVCTRVFVVVRICLGGTWCAGLCRMGHAGELPAPLRV